MKSSVATLPAVPTVTLSSLIVNPPIAPVPAAVIPVKAEPSPEKAVALTVPPLKVNVEASSNSPAVPATTTRPDVKSDTFALEATTESLKVETPEVTTNPPELTLTPVLAVTIPIESILVFSSLVNVPATDTFPVKLASPTTVRVDPSKVNLVVSSNSPLVPTITTLLSVRSEILAVIHLHHHLHQQHQRM